MERKSKQWRQHGRSGRGFTLIELLVVISVIAVLAGLVASLLPAVGDASKRKNTQGQLGQLVLAIENYKQTRGYYPPSSADRNRAGTNSLYYELTGAVYTPDPQGNPKSFTDIQNAAVTPVTLANAFQIDGILNSGKSRGEVKNFLLGWKDKLIQPTATGVKVLTLTTKGPGGDFNTWQYDSASTNRYNAESFDLWADILIGGKKVTISNWKQ